MKEPSTNQMTWLIRNVDKGVDAVGFIRDHKESFFIVRSNTGSYYGGHGESWKGKWEEFLREGFVLSDEAFNRKWIPSDWVPPKISKQDGEIIEKIKKGIL